MLNNNDFNVRYVTIFSILYRFELLMQIFPWTPLISIENRYYAINTKYKTFKKLWIMSSSIKYTIVDGFLAPL